VSSVSVSQKLRRRPVKRQAARAALIHLYPNGLPDNKVAVVIWNSVNRRLRELGKQPVGQKSNARCGTFPNRADNIFTTIRLSGPTRP
jgi:hypothetical protein